MWRRRSPSVMMPDQPAVGVGDADAAEALFGHHQQRVAPSASPARPAAARPARASGRRPVRSIAPSLPPGCSTPKSAGGEAAPLEQRHGQRVAERDLQGGRGGRRVQRGGGLRRVGQQQHDVGGAAERAVGDGGDGDQRNGEALGVGDDVGAARAVSPDLDRARTTSPAPIMPRSPWLASVAWTNMGRRAGGGQGGGDLARHVAGLADAGQDDPAGRGGEDLDRLDGRAAPRLSASRAERLGLGRQHAAGDGDGVEVAHWPVLRPASAAAARWAMRGGGRRRRAALRRRLRLGVPNGAGERAPRPCGQTAPARSARPRGARRGRRRRGRTWRAAYSSGRAPRTGARGRLGARSRLSAQAAKMRRTAPPPGERGVDVEGRVRASGEHASVPSVVLIARGKGPASARSGFKDHAKSTDQAVVSSAKQANGHCRPSSAFGKRKKGACQITRPRDDQAGAQHVRRAVQLRQQIAAPAMSSRAVRDKDVDDKDDGQDEPQVAA